VAQRLEDTGFEFTEFVLHRIFETSNIPFYGGAVNAANEKSSGVNSWTTTISVGISR
jgi:hypothetical protein